MKICCISDLHGHLPEIPRSDLLIIAGDICPVWNHDLVFQTMWLDRVFGEWLQKVPAKHIVGIAGNHDWVFQKRPDHIPKLGLPWTYLEDSGTEINGVAIYGSPWQPRFCDWAFNADEAKLKEVWGKIPLGTEILITHGPPHGIFDMVDSVRHAGCIHLLSAVDIVRPRLHVFGHIHGNTGVTRLGRTTFVNAAVLDEQYRPLGAPPIVLNITFGATTSPHNDRVDSIAWSVQT